MTTANSCRTARVGFLVCLVATCLAILYGRLMRGAEDDGPKPSLKKSVREVTVFLGDKTVKVQATQFQGAGKQLGCVVRTQEELARLIETFGQEAPSIDFQGNIVIFLIASYPAAVRVSADAVKLENGKLKTAVMTQMLMGSEPKESRPFTVVVFPKSAINVR